MFVRNKRRQAWFIALPMLLALGLCAQAAWGQAGPISEDFGRHAEGAEIEMNPDRPKDIPPPTAPLKFDFEETPLFEVIKAIGAMTGKNFLIDPNLAQDKITLITHSDIAPEMALFILEAVLSFRNFQMVDSLDGNIVIVSQMGPDQHQDKIPVIVGDQPPPPGFDNLSTHVLPVHHQLASEMKPLLERVGSGKGRIDAYENINTLIITDSADAVRNMIKLLEAVDVPGNDVQIELFTLEYTRAETLATQISDVLLGPEAQAAQSARAARPAAPPTPTPVSTRRPGAAGAAQPQGEVIGQREDTLRIVFDERINAIIAVATESYMEDVRELIEMLDQPTPSGSDDMHIYQLLNADAETVAEALNSMVGGVTPQKEQEGAPTAEVAPFEKTVQITAYPETNAILVLASPIDYKKLSALLARLDVPRRQVHVESIIMDVIISDDFSLNVESAALSETDFFALSNVANMAAFIAGGVSGGIGSLVGSGGTIGVLDGTTDITQPDGSVVTVPNIPLLMKMLNTMTTLDILSQPGLTTVDNEEASIIVGQEVPFPTGTSRGLDQNATNSTIFSRVEREDVGIKLNVTPQISEGEYVNLQLEVEVSQTVASNVGADVNILGPTVQKSQVSNKVVIKDGSIGIIGGLISEQTNKNVQQTPVLGDVPLLGWLFRNKGTGRGKRNMVVLVSPNIVKDSTDFSRFTDYKLHEFKDSNVDVLFEKGFIKKTAKKQDLRNNYRPSEKHTEKLLRPGSAGVGFSRGDRE